MVIVMLVIMTETTADLLAIGVVVGRPADRQDRRQRPAGGHLSTAVSGGLLNGFPVSAFAQNVGLVALTGIKSRFVVAVSGGILLVLGLFPKVGAIVAALPLPVLGGAGLALFGTVAASGIRSLAAVDYDGNSNLVIVALSIGMGVIPIAVADFYDALPVWFQTIFDSGISAAAVTAVLLNILFNGMRRDAEAPIAAEGPTPGVMPDEDVPGGRSAQLTASPRRAWGGAGRRCGPCWWTGRARRGSRRASRRRSRRRPRARRCGPAPPRPARPCRRSPGR